MFLLLYDIEGKKDPHGIRIRLVRALRGVGAFQIQRSSWIVEHFDDRLRKILDELRCAGGSVKIMEWLPRTINDALGYNLSKKIVLAPLSAEPVYEGWHEKIKSALESLGFKVMIVPVGESAAKALSKERKQKYEKSLSRLLDEISLMDIDGLVILNSGRSTQSGILYVAQMVSKTKLLKNIPSLPLVQVERSGKHDGAIILWNDSFAELLEAIKKATGLDIIRPSLEVKKVSKEGNREIRQIQYAEVGDKIIINGQQVGVCLSNNVYLIAENGRLAGIIGGKMYKRAKSIIFESLAEVIVKTTPSRF
ncbi:MAG: DUF2117 domain-containing protein [Candidatus Methanomethyliaceae archaeon]|nr:DUF2117 domain-containing protein [Candidatus Methanomethyliaceae archaeon]